MIETKFKRVYKKLRDSARGEECQLRIYPYCNGNPETTVLCHIPSGSGFGQKSPDWFAVYACSSCHDIIDSRCKSEFTQEEIKEFTQVGLYRTWERMIEKDLISIN